MINLVLTPSPEALAFGRVAATVIIPVAACPNNAIKI
jgi:hypothetical protein